MVHEKYYELLKKQEELLNRKNVKSDFYNGVYDRYEYPVLTREHIPLTWRYDLNKETNPYFMERLGAMSVGRILAGEMPTIVSEQFSLAGLSPYPTLGVDRFWCSCPDWSKPCKHIAAVLYLLGDALIRDPSLLLRLRGVCFGKRDAAGVALPLWKGSIRLADALARIYRRTGLADGR